MKHTVSVLVTFIFCTIVTAQQTFYHTDKDMQYRKAVELYNNGKYSAAQLIFDDYLARTCR